MGNFMTKWVKMRQEHLEMVMNWRMQPDITRVMYTDPILTLDMQSQWFERIKDDPGQLHWITVKDGIPIGKTSLTDIDYNNKSCVSGNYIADKEHRTFENAITDAYGILKVAFEHLGLNRLQAEVMGNNPRVVELNKMFGYHVDGVRRQAVYKYDIFHDVTVLSYLKEEWDAGKFRHKIKNLEIEL